MEASVDLSSPKKASRPAYRPMWEQAERELHGVRELVDRLKSALVTAQNEAQYYWRNFVGMAVVAIVEALALIALLLR